MREFSILGFVEHLAAMTAEVEIEKHHALEKAALVIEKEAKAEIGAYQGRASPFVAWAELADGTKADRVAEGFTENDPLFRTGDMRDTIEHTVKGDEAHIGSDSEIAEYQELGTSRIPPRSFLGGAAVRKGPEVAAICGDGVYRALVGAGVAGRALPIEAP